MYLDSYIPVRKLGEGGLGVVHLVKNPKDNTLWAVKHLKTTLTDQSDQQRFKREIRVLQSLEHPSIVRLAAVQPEISQNCFIMEFVPGYTLKQRIYEQDTYDDNWIRLALKWMLNICMALEYIHQQRLIHRDLKPSNIIVDTHQLTGSIKILDFGLCRHQYTGQVITQSHTAVGSALYMSPEQARGDPLDARTDLYSLGVMMYETLAGQPPFIADNPVALLGMHQLRSPRFPREINSSIPEQIQNLIMTLLEKQSCHRPSSAAQTAEYLNQFLNSESCETPVLNIVSAGKNLFEVPLVARDEEMKKLQGDALKAIQKKSGFILITGEAGIGKTKLVQSFKRQPLFINQCLSGSYYSQDSRSIDGILDAFHKLIENNRDRIRFIQDNLHDWELPIWEYLTQGAKVFTTRSQSSNNFPIWDTAQVIWKIFRLTVPEERFVLILEDIHWADKDLFDLLRSVFSMRRNTQSFCIIATARDEEIVDNHPLNSFIDEMKHLDVFTHIPLNRLSRQQTGHMVNAMLGGALEESSLQLIMKLTEGNPLFVSELVKDLKEEEYLSEHGGSWRISTITGLELPGKIHQLMQNRLRLFKGNSQRLLQIAAVIGTAFPGKLHEITCSIPENDYLDAFDSLLRHKLILENDKVKDQYYFSHAAIRDAVYGSISSKRKESYHRKIAETMETLTMESVQMQPEQIAKHYESGNAYEKAIKWRFRAAEKAKKICCFNSQSKQLRYAELDISKGIFTHEEKRIQTQELYLELGSLERRVGHFDTAIKMFQTVISLSSGNENTPIQGQVLMKLGSLYGMQGRFEEASALLLKAKIIFEKLKNTDRVADCLANLGASASAACLDKLSEDYNRQACEFAKDTKDLHLLSRCLINWALALSTVGKSDQALASYERALPVARRLKDKRVIAFTLYGISALYSQQGNLEKKLHEKVVRMMSEAIEVLSMSRDIRMLAGCHFFRAKSKAVLGLDYSMDLERAKAIARELDIHALKLEIERWQNNLDSGCNKT